MSFNIIEASDTIASKYRRYLKTMFDIKDPEYKRIFDRRMEDEDTFQKGPYLDVTNSFEKGRSVKQLIEDGILCQDFEKIERLYNIPNLHKHQEEALLKAEKGNNLVVSTGTGSGKTECFLLPIINELMREKESSPTNTISPGVRALIVYPMNALANDQIDRLRKLFIEYPDITFGCYTGQTKQHEEDMKNNPGALSQYRHLNGNRIDDVRLREPIPNEILSRDRMKENPPHILITNYAMLEFLMLRPADSVFFTGDFANNWKFIVLDEAHTYKGSTGIEVSMLLKRLQATLNNPSIQYILTSATLGDENSNEEVIDFATSLCSAPFEIDNIIRAKRINLKPSEQLYRLGTSFYNDLAEIIAKGYDDDYVIKYIEDNYHFNISETNLGAYLYQLLIQDETFWMVKKYLSKTKSIAEIKSYTRWTEQTISNFVEVASIANYNNSKLFDSRYHMFLRATEGVFITLAPHKDLFLKRKNIDFYDGQQYKVFETVSCSQCHSLYILGYIKDGFLVQKQNGEIGDTKEAFYIGDQVNDTDEDTTLAKEELETEPYELCPHCGFIRSSKAVHKEGCGHSESEYVKLIKVKTTKKKDGRITKCICCENTNNLGILRGFFSGQEASTSVIGTALFEELPSHVKKIKIHTTSLDDEDDLFGDIEDTEETIEEAKAKQFIAFSDSRQAAAYFSSYFSRSYDGILYGRLIKEEIDSMSRDSKELSLFVNDLAARFENDNIIPFDEYLQNLDTFSAQAYDYNKIAWQAMLKSFVDCNSRTSLYGLGLLGLDFNSKIKFMDIKKYDLTAEDVKNICMVFVMGMLADAAMYYPINMQKKDIEFFTNNGVEKTYLYEKGDKYTRAFVPQNDSFSNKRMDYIMRVCNIKDKAEAKKILHAIWVHFFEISTDPKIPRIMFRDKKAHYEVNTTNLIITKPKKWYKCSKCNKITLYNVKNRCPSYRCDGTLEEFDANVEEKGNHYYEMYNELSALPLRVVEHTAQLDRDEAYKYQTLFKDQKIDVLSCSTTFEMGVDVGDLETVFMRNMPPSPSNYAQRAGRAGRSSSSAAYALTFCNKSNHDFNYFEEPTRMINGIINPPRFKTDNAKICIRHLYSAVFSFFFKKYPTYFADAKTFLDINEDTHLSGYDVLEQYVYSYPTEIKDYLNKCFDTNLAITFKIDTFGWADWLFKEKNDEYPNLKMVRDRYLEEIKTLKQQYEQLKSEGSFEQYGYSKRINNYENESIITFLSRNNILPKYGFPVDTVELKINTGTDAKDLSGLELSRDLSMAISEYAPGCQIVANDQLITSRYVAKEKGYDWKLYDYIECNTCKTVKVDTHKVIKVGDKHPLCTCSACQNIMKTSEIKTFIIPEFGFVADPEVEKPGLIKPERTYKTEATFYNYDGQTKENIYNIDSTTITVEEVNNNGEMALLNNTDFFICETCGYAEEAPNNTMYKTTNKKHKNPNGYPCSSQVLTKYSLGYKYKTDIIRIRIKETSAVDPSKYYDEAYTVLQALILAACDVLDIDDGEIAGCLQYYGQESPYSYILYDTTPGGAGHVKRINDKNVLYQVLSAALNRAQKCTGCSEDSSCYSCLRTYQNQRHHDIIKRDYAINYLSKVLDSSHDPSLDSQLEEKLLDYLQRNAQSWKVSFDEKNIYHATYNDLKWTIEPQYYLDRLQNVVKPCKPDFLLTPENPKQKPIAVFTDGFTFHGNIVGNDSIKRDAIIYSGNYRVWSLSYNDVANNQDKDKFTQVFDSSNLPGTLDQKYIFDDNQLAMLMNYLSDENAEIMYTNFANNYAKAMFGANYDVKKFKYEIDSLYNQINFVDINNSKVDRYDFGIDHHLKFYLFNTNNHFAAISYINDILENRKDGYVKDWCGYLHFNNIMQFLDSFIITSESGLSDEIYTILNNAAKITEDMDAAWADALLLLSNEAKEFANKCMSNKMLAPSSVGYELDDGSIAEMVWEDLNLAYLTSEQLDCKEALIKEGFNVITAFEDIKKILDE